MFSTISPLFLTFKQQAISTSRKSLLAIRSQVCKLRSLHSRFLLHPYILLLLLLLLNISYTNHHRQIYIAQNRYIHLHHIKNVYKIYYPLQTNATLGSSTLIYVYCQLWRCCISKRKGRLCLC